MNRFSSRRQRLDASFLTPRLQSALRYDRIAGYFCSSILEVAGEALETVRGPIRLVCNLELDPQDVITAKAAQAAMRQPRPPNNLLAFIQQISLRTRSLLLATARPVQSHPIEAWDLLEALSRGSDAVLGTPGSAW